MPDSWRIEFGPVDAINPGCGYFICIERNGRTELFVSKHPVTGADLDYHSCVEVAAMYGPKKQAA